MNAFSRRDCLKLAGSTWLGGCLGPDALAADPAEPKRVAAVVTIYRHNSHADVILGKILEGWRQDGGPGPALKLVSLYVDQFPDDDMARSICAKFNVPIFDSIEKAITVGGDSIPVNGVISIGEHGDYPYNELGQHLYPRRRFFSEITDTFEKYGRVVPVFNDKHLGPTWTDAKWMYDRARQLNVPLMAGSSMPVGYRLTDETLPMNCEIEAAVGIGYSGLDIYGIHALELFQYYVERRRGAEQGVRSVRWLQGPEMWQMVDSGLVSQQALDAAFALVPKSGNPDIHQDEEAGMFLFEYADGLHGALFMLGCAVGTAVGVKIKGQAEPVAFAFDERSVPRHPHFAYLLKAIERMVYTGKPTYPVERTLLTGGILDAALTSRFHGGKTIDTPHLSIAYQPVDYPHADRIDLRSEPGR